MIKFTLIAIVVLMAGQAWGADYSGEYVDKKNGGNIEVIKNGNPNDEYEIHLLVVTPGTARIGDLTFSGFINKGETNYVEQDCSLDLKFMGKIVTVKQDISKGTCGAGMNVTFGGTYKKSKK